MSKSETAILLITCLLALFFALEFAICAGILLSLVRYLQRIASEYHQSSAPFLEAETVIEQ